MIKQHDYIVFKKNHDVLLITTRNRIFDSNDEKNDDENNLINFKKNKRRFKTHSNSFIFINEMNFIWRVWKTKMHDKMTINVDHYDTNLFAITFVIEWIVDEIDDHIQSIRDIDINHFKNWHMMLKFMIIVFENSNYKRNMRNEFRTLIMNIQNFQISLRLFFILIIQSIITKSSKSKNWWTKYFEIWKKQWTFDFVNLLFLTRFALFCNKYTIDKRVSKKEKIVARQQRLKLFYFKFIFVVLISISFTKFVTSIFFVKFAIHFHFDVDTKFRDLLKIQFSQMCSTNVAIKVQLYESINWN